MNIDEVFENSFTKLSRSDLESLPCPFDVTNISNETMQEMVDMIENNYQQEMTNDMSDDIKDDIWWKIMEDVVVLFDVPYLEDYSDKEYEEYLERRNSIEE